MAEKKSEKKPEWVEVIIRTTDTGKMFNHRAILCRDCDQISLRFGSEEVVVFKGEKFSLEEYEKQFGKIK